MSIRIDDADPIILERPGQGGVLGSGPTVPSDNALGYAHGCVFAKTNGTGTTDALYVNVGTLAAANFDPITVALASSLFTTTLRPYAVPLNELRIWNDFDSFLPETAATDDLGFTEGTYATSAPSLTSIDFKAASTEAFGRVQVPVPADYVAGQPITVVLNVTADSDASVGQAVDVVVVRTAAPSTDICATGDLNVDGYTADDVTFTITPTNVVPGDILDIRIEVDAEDSDGTSPTMFIVIHSLTVNFTTKIPA